MDSFEDMKVSFYMAAKIIGQTVEETCDALDLSFNDYIKIRNP